MDGNVIFVPCGEINLDLGLSLTHSLFKSLALIV